MKSKSRKLLPSIVFSSLSIVLAVIIAVGNILAFGVYRGVLTSYFGVKGASETNFETNQYFERTYATAEEASEYAENVGKQIEAEGAVLLKNENNALPLKRKSKVSCFSQSSVDFIYVSLGGSGTVPASGVLTLKQALESEGFSVNKTLWDFYTAKGNKRLTGGLAQSTSFNPNPWALNEVPYDQYTSGVKSSYAEYNDAAIVVISRMGCENGDLPRWDDKETGSILELDSNEREMLKNVCLNFDRVVVLLNTGNAMECGFLDEFDIDACLWVGGVGRYGIESVAKILSGEINPSGRLVDTYAYDVFSSPAMQNMGNFGYYYNGSHSSSHHYVNYAEGIYVGYKYYETRYEDQILKQGQASVGGFDYDKVVQFPFGYGLGYTEFVWDNFKCEVHGNNVEISLTVTNIGFEKGKDVVQVYYQSPYTDYDKENGIEKSAINLATYVKTKELEGGESQNVTLYFAIEDMKSYDASGKGTYLLEGSDQYYITAASDAHKAVKNILQAKGQDVGGDVSFVKKQNFATKKYDKDSSSGAAIGNLLSDALLSDAVYLSRSDWSVMNNDGLRYGELDGKDSDGKTYKKNMSAELKAKMETVGYEAAGAPEEKFETPVTDERTEEKVSLIKLKTREFDDPMWDTLLNRLSVDEMVELAKLSGFRTMAITSIEKPLATDADGPSGLNTLIGDSVRAGGFPYEIVLASTWNTDLAEDMGDAMGELCLWAKIQSASRAPNLTGWYAPAMNIHRTPFGGRNFEYFSEDGTMSGTMGAAIVRGASQKGVISYIKHFAFNEQETNRMTDNATWGQEQAFREIYLKPFEMTIKENLTVTENGEEFVGPVGVMTAYNRIGTTWTGGSYALITGILRKEWGFNGIVVTDYMDGTWENVDQMLAAGGSIALNPVNNQNCTSNTAQALTYLRRAAKTTLYSFVNSNGMNGIDGATIVRKGTPIFYGIMAWVDVALGALFVGSVVVAVISIVKLKNKNKKENMEIK